MGIGRFIHHFGAFLLFAATVLLVVVDISAPVVNHISLLKVEVNNGAGPDVTFGTFGYCVLNDNASDNCSKSRIGYNPASVISGVDSTEFSSAAENTSKALTNVMVLHPVATGLCFIAFILAIFAGRLGSLVASLISLLSFIVTLVALACDFAGLQIIRRRVNRADNNSTASFGVAIWLVVVAAALTLMATVIVFFTCCSGRRRRRHGEKKMSAYGSPTRY